MKLSEAIRAGAKLGPQCFGTMLSEGGSCAIGAAFWALHGTEKSPVGLMHEIGSHWMPDAWIIMFRGTIGSTCPVCRDAHLDMSHVITHLNDDHHLSREAIAEWVETIEKKLEEQSSTPGTALARVGAATCTPQAGITTPTAAPVLVEAR